MTAKKCPECATVHSPDKPHNQQSLTYQCKFFEKYGRWPTWSDAMLHCDDQTKQAWTEELLKKGIKVQKAEDKP